jgi:hypothetical protein
MRCANTALRGGRCRLLALLLGANAGSWAQALPPVAPPLDPYRAQVAGTSAQRSAVRASVDARCRAYEEEQRRLDAHRMAQDRLYPGQRGRAGLFDDDPAEAARRRELRRMDEHSKACSPSDRDVQWMNNGQRDLKKSYADKFEPSWRVAVGTAAKRIEPALVRVRQSRPCSVEVGNELARLSIDLGAWPAFGRMVDAPGVAVTLWDCSQTCQAAARFGAEVCLADAYDAAGRAAAWRQAADRLAAVPPLRESFSFPIQECGCLRVRDAAASLSNSLSERHRGLAGVQVLPSTRDAALRARGALDQAVARETAALR